MKVYELIIIGAGPAGITAAIYAARGKLDFLVISKDIGGQTLLSSEVENYTGYHFLKGSDLVKKFEEHLKDYKINLKLGEEVRDIKRKGKIFEIKTDKSNYLTKTIIIASGKKSRKLNVPGEERLYNRGLTYCAICDAPLFQDKTVAVVGGGNSALDATLQLIKIAKKIYLINISPQPKGEKIRIERIKQSNKVTILNNAKTTEILGNKFVTGLKLIQNNEEQELNVQGVFVEIGLIPNSDFAKIVKKNKWNEIMIKRTTVTMQENMTNIPEIFAAGDVTDIPAKQIIVAAGEGAKALLAVSNYLNKQNEEY